MPSQLTRYWLGLTAVCMVAACSSKTTRPPARVDVSDMPSASELGLRRGATAEANGTGSAAVPPGAATAGAGADPVGAGAGATAPGSAAQPATMVRAPNAARGSGVAAAHNFATELQLLFRIAACGSDTALPATMAPDDVVTIAAHCRAIAQRIAKYRSSYMTLAQPFLAALTPPDVPTTLLYPFGGGDLLSALVAFPKATSITTISLELAGDPRRITTLHGPALRQSLGALRSQIGGLLSVGSNTSENLSAQQRNELPGQVSSFLLGLATVGATPIALRFFRIDIEGTLHYVTDDELAALEHAGLDAPRQRGPATAGTAKSALATRRKTTWNSPNFAEAFANVEIEFHLAGETTTRIHRHIGWNLASEYLVDHPELLAYLTQLTAPGRIAVLVKGASYLLWHREFATIRTFLLDHLAWMLSDSTGIPPAFASAAHMQQTTYGDYDGAFLPGAEAGWTSHSDAFRKLWRSQPRRRLPFRFGYVDAAKQAHLLVTQPHRQAAATPR